MLKQLTGLNYCETDKNRGVESSKKMATDKKDTLSLPDTKDTLTVLPEAVQDDYTASIELSNACREFYRNRVKATENFKQNIGNNKATSYRRTSIDDAMEKLRNEMASLMDQDLSLMKQLLTLNEAIEDLKVKRLYHVSKDSLRASSQEMHASDWSVSETDMFDSEDNLAKKIYNKPVSSTHSLPVPVQSSAVTDTANLKLSKTGQRSCDITILVNGTPLKVRHGQQNSLDSGYGDDDHFSHVYTGPMEVTI